MLYARLFHIANTLESEGFEALIKSLMKEREENMLEKSNLTIKMDPKIAKIFENSQNMYCILLFSLLCLVEKGKSYKLLHKAILNDQSKVRQQGEEKLKDTASFVPELKRKSMNSWESLIAKMKRLRSTRDRLRCFPICLSLGLSTERELDQERGESRLELVLI